MVALAVSSKFSTFMQMQAKRLAGKNVTDGSAVVRTPEGVWQPPPTPPGVRPSLRTRYKRL